MYSIFLNERLLLAIAPKIEKGRGNRIDYLNQE